MLAIGFFSCYTPLLEFSGFEEEFTAFNLLVPALERKLKKEELCHARQAIDHRLNFIRAEWHRRSPAESEFLLASILICLPKMGRPASNGEFQLTLPAQRCWTNTRRILKQ
jgi:hypothetical protein